MLDTPAELFRYFYVQLLNMFGTPAVWIESQETPPPRREPVDVSIVDQGRDAYDVIVSVLTLLIGAATVGVVVATAVIAWRALDDVKKTRHAQLMLSMREQWTQPTMVDAMELYGKYDNAAIQDLVRSLFLEEETGTDAELDTYHKLVSWPNLIEVVGVLWSEGAISTEAVYKMWGGSILRIWQAWEPTLPQLRKIPDVPPGALTHFQALARALEEHAAGKARVAEGA